MLCFFVFFVLFSCFQIFLKKIKNWIGGWVGGVWIIRVFLGFLDLFLTWQDPLAIKQMFFLFSQLISSSSKAENIYIGISVCVRTTLNTGVV